MSRGQFRSSTSGVGEAAGSATAPLSQCTGARTQVRTCRRLQCGLAACCDAVQCVAVEIVWLARDAVQLAVPNRARQSGRGKETPQRSDWTTAGGRSTARAQRRGRVSGRALHLCAATAVCACAVHGLRAIGSVCVGTQSGGALARRPVAAVVLSSVRAWSRPQWCACVCVCVCVCAFSSSPCAAPLLCVFAVRCGS